MGKELLQSDRNATLLIDVLRFYGKEGKFQLHGGRTKASRG
jgi:hypothetical protein